MTNPYSRRIAAVLDILALLCVVVICWTGDVLLAGPWWMQGLLVLVLVLVLAVACVVHAGVLRNWSH